MRRFALLLALAATFGAPAAWAATTHDVDIDDNAYKPSSLTVPTGDTVRWTNRDVGNHTVTFTTDERGKPEHQVLPTRSRIVTFSTPGTYRYFCEVHPSMQGSVVVQGTSGASTSTTRRSTTTSTTQDARGSAITAPPDTSTTTTSTTTTTALPPEGDAGLDIEDPDPPDDVEVPGPPDHPYDNVDGPAAIAALLLVAVTGTGSYLVRRAESR